MIAYFPTGYKDELLYSMIARYGIHTNQVNNHKAVVEDVFGKKTAVAIADLPSNLEAFRERVKKVWPTSVLDLIYKQTLAPIYLPFLSEQQAHKVITSMQSDFGGNIHTRAGINASSIQLVEQFRYCPVCVIEQQKKLGETYWLRRHQLPCIEVCLDHQCNLINSEIPFYPKQKHHFQAAEAVNKNMSIESITLSMHEKKLISSYYELLEINNIAKASYSQWSRFYQNLALDANMMKGSRVDHNAIYHHIHDDWVNTQFEKYLPEIGENSWLLHMFRKHRKSFHPIRHLMVLSSFFKDHLIENIIAEVTDLPIHVGGKASFIKKRSDKETLEKKGAWLLLCKKHPEDGILSLRKRESGARLYTWLYRYDRSWLFDNSPSPKRANLKHYKKDYATWDEENIILLNLLIKDLQLLQKRPRASKAYFMKQLPKSSSVEKHLEDLPKTTNWLEINQEDKVSYRKYRLNVATQMLKDLNLPIIQWRLIRLASIRKEFVTADIEAYIENIIKEARAVIPPLITEVKSRELCG